MRRAIIFRKAGLYISTFILVACYPFTAMADAQELTSPPIEGETSSQQSPPSTETATQTTSAPEKPKLTYTYNKDTGTWDSEKWQYNPLTGTYEKPPTPIVIEPAIEDKSKLEVDKTVDTTVKVDNEVDSTAASGDAAIVGNTLAGNAISGDANVAATIINSVNSTIGDSANQGIVEFTHDVLGDVKGDIVLGPLLLKTMLEAKAPESAKTTVNTSTNFDINNDMMLNATSGDATVAKNTTAGNATSGSATAMANVVNILNSLIAAQQSFIGTINIYGSLEGDILIAPDFIPQMIANNGVNEADIKVSSQDTQTIVNNISAVAESGAASVFGNTSGGSAISGDAASSVVIFNLSGHEVISKNSMLVFVNVLGRWVGVIVGAPEGATAAMIGNGVESHNYNPELTVNSQSAYGITNTIAVNAASGDALVAHNTSGGNAVSGSAKAMANIANVAGSQFSASDWFGVLFINITNDWLGSFGVDTPFGNDPEDEEAAPTSRQPIEFRPTSAAVETRVATNVRYQLFQTYSQQIDDTLESESTSSNVDEAITSTLGTADSLPRRTTGGDYRYAIIIGSIIVIGLSLIGFKRLFV